MYTLDGQMLENLEQLKSYCEEPLTLDQKKKVLIHDEENLNDRAADDNNLESTKVNKASFIFNPV